MHVLASYGPCSMVDMGRKEDKRGGAGREREWGKGPGNRKPEGIRASHSHLLLPLHPSRWQQGKQEANRLGI